MSPRPRRAASASIEIRSGNPGVIWVRAATLADVEAILALETAAFAEDRLSPHAIRRFVAMPHQPVLVAGFGDRVDGYALLTQRRGGRACRIYSMAVDPQFRGRGVGRTLLQACERHARAQGRQALRLEVRYDNEAAMRLYRSQGFREFGPYPQYYGDGAQALRFEKLLAPAARNP